MKMKERHVSSAFFGKGLLEDGGRGRIDGGGEDVEWTVVKETERGKKSSGS